MAIFLHQLMKKSRMVMKFDPMAFQNIIQVFLCIFLSLYNIIIIIYDWITIMRYSKHELSKIYMSKNCDITPSPPHKGHLSTQQPLSSVSKVAIVERTVAFNSCIIMIFNKGTIQNHSILLQLCYFWQYLIKILYFLYHYKLECTL